MKSTFYTRIFSFLGALLVSPPNIVKGSQNPTEFYQGDVAPEWFSFVEFYGYERANELAMMGIVDKPKIARGATLPNEPGSRLWRNWVQGGIYQIPIYISSAFNSESKKMIRNDLFKLQQDAKAFEFVFLDSRSDLQEGLPYIYIIDGSGCWSYLGRIDDAIDGQKVSLEESKCLTTRLIQHEVMHALGFDHEQCRPDRDDYITIKWNNIEEGHEHNFDINYDVNTLGTEYDLLSIMQYSPNAYAKDESKPTTIAKDPKHPYNDPDFEKSASASWIDIIELRLLYQCKSGPRFYKNYQDQPCSADCPCWKDEIGCGNSDSACLGDLVCTSNKCSNPSTGTDPKPSSYIVTGYNWWNSPEPVDGYMFDLQPKEEPISIKNFSLYLGNSQGDVKIEIYWRRGTYRGVADSSEGWIKIGTTTVNYDGSGGPQMLPENTFSPVDILAWYKVSFYITTTVKNSTPFLAPQATMYGKRSWFENDDMRVIQGCGLAYPFDDFLKYCRKALGGQSYNLFGGVEYTILDDLTSESYGQQFSNGGHF